ncbi:MAG: 2-oxo acid dehydrogenase subunit E2 [Alphaproteobacteria bacterium]|nr:2-oxo acid dehydrogenase subunit E2 [Alphaproteobacteria bacterium]MCB9791453.1 2-oxo acid dehydrogenase subunit E2 [Alphaproteobacteria bacterium]
MTPRRKLSIASWSAPSEGNIYGKLTVDATAVLDYIEQVRETTGEKVTITHIVGCAIGRALAAAPGLNGRILFGRFLPFETVDIAYLVVLEGGHNLAKAKIHDADKKEPSHIAAELRELAERLRKGKDENFEKGQGPLKLLPTWIIRPLVWATGWLTGALGIELRALGLERFPFGACVITSVGMLGIDEGFAPPTPWARAPAYVLIGAIKEEPAVVDGALVVRPQLTLCATIDHRFVDGFQIGIMARELRAVFANPWSLHEGGAPPTGATDVVEEATEVVD